MMGPEYFTVAGYLTDGCVLCRDCGEKQALKVRDQITVAQAEADFPKGLSCDACFREIVEPVNDVDDEDLDGEDA